MIHEQKISSIIRHFSVGQYGDPYDYCWNILYHDIETVEILGVAAPPSLKITRELICYFKSIGVKKLVSKRHGRSIIHNLDK